MRRDRVPQETDRIGSTTELGQVLQGVALGHGGWGRSQTTEVGFQGVTVRVFDGREIQVVEIDLGRRGKFSQARQDVLRS
jgi:hypothetical protein